jgi:hypothetical protein
VVHVFDRGRGVDGGRRWRGDWRGRLRLLAVEELFEWRVMRRLFTDQQFRQDMAEAAMGSGCDGEHFVKSLYKMVRVYKRIGRKRRSANKKGQL